MKMKRARKVRLFSTLLAAPLMWAGVAHANLVLNGDFETDGSQFVTYPGYIGQGGNPSQIPDWPLSSSDLVGVTSGSITGPDFFANGGDTTYVAFLQHAVQDTAPTTLAQTIGGFVPGETYSLTFQYNARDPSAFLSSGGGLPDLSFSVANLTDDLGIVSPVGGSNPYYSFAGDFVAGPSGT
jgi:hypothetical protein